ncbi:MAG TPA: hypothetical protein VKX49_09300 [Bryobacteraceae bacterium]|nr:hypothetical protein [Bryobacteraceae bacterium]
MLRDPHFSDQELLLGGEGELPGRRARQLAEHLSSCAECRERKESLEAASAQFQRLYEQDIRAQMAVGAQRAQLRARLAEAEARDQHRGVLLLVVSTACALGLLAVLSFGYWTSRRETEASRVVFQPNHDLTPGVAAPVGKSMLCAGGAAKNRMVPVSLRRQVFEEYGIRQAEPQAYEVDYLITPALGGADDIRNLWPQSYFATVWNAKVKDALEDRLHDLVCDGQLDLATAQRDISADWVSAYKKYFHTNKPLGTH